MRPELVTPCLHRGQIRLLPMSMTANNSEIPAQRKCSIPMLAVTCCTFRANIPWSFSQIFGHRRAQGRWWCWFLPVVGRMCQDVWENWKVLAITKVKLWQGLFAKPAGEILSKCFQLDFILSNRGTRLLTKLRKIFIIIDSSKF